MEVVDQAIDRLIDLVLRTSASVNSAPKTFDKAAHHLTAQEVDEGSIVLLKNKNKISAAYKQAQKSPSLAISRKILAIKGPASAL